MSDIDTVVMDSLKALDPNRPIKKRTSRRDLHPFKQHNLRPIYDLSYWSIA